MSNSEVLEIEAIPGAVKPDPILSVKNLVRTFGGLKAVDVKRLEIQRGQITALIGPNGAGKTTFFNLITGFDTPDTGEWSYNGETMTKLSSHQMAKKGMVRTFQLTKSLSRLSVIQNMMLGAGNQKGEFLGRALLPFVWKDQEKAIEKRADELLERFNMAHMREEYAASLSGGQRKLLEMARALMADPEIVMLDEPMAGVNPALTQELLSHVKDLREEGRTIVFVEHDMDVVRDISDWVVVMAQGEIIAEGPHESIGANQEVIDAYLGRHHDQEMTSDKENPSDVETADEPDGLTEGDDSEDADE